jgi:hypothetical protein
MRIKNLLARISGLAAPKLLRTLIVGVCSDRLILGVFIASHPGLILSHRPRIKEEDDKMD